MDSLFQFKIGKVTSIPPKTVSGKVVSRLLSMIKPFLIVTGFCHRKWLSLKVSTLNYITTLEKGSETLSETS